MNNIKNLEMSPLIRRSTVALVILVLAALPACAQEPAFRNPRDIPEGAKYIVLSESMATLVQQKHGLPANTWRFPVAGLVAFPNQNLADDFKSLIGSKFGGLPIDYAQVKPGYHQGLPPNDLVRIGIRVSPAPVRTSVKGLARRPQRPDETTWLVARVEGECFQLPGDTQAILMASPGTIFNATAEREVALKTGRIWIFCANRKLHVSTSSGKIAVEPCSVVAVEQNFFGKLKVAALDGFAPEFQPSDGGDRVAVQAGTTITVTENTVANAGSSDFIASASMASSAGTCGKFRIINDKVESCKAEFIDELVRRRPPFTTLSMERRYEHMMARYGLSSAERIRQMAFGVPDQINTSVKPSAYSASLDQRYFVPVFKSRLAAEPASLTIKARSLSIKTLWHKRCVAKYLSDTSINTDEFGRVTLKSGELLVCAEEPIRVKAGDAEVFMGKGVIASVSCSDRGLITVRNYKEMWLRDVMVTTAGRSMKCSAGHEIILGRSVKEISDYLARDPVGRRSTQFSEFNQSNSVICKSEFSLSSAMKTDDLLTRLYRSADNSDKRIVAEIIKMDAVLTAVTGSKGRFTAQARRRAN